MWAGWIMGVLNGVWRCFHGPLATSRLFVLPPPGGGGGRRSEWGCSSGSWVLEAGKARCASYVVCSSWWALNRVRQRAGVPRCFYRQRAAGHKPLTTCRRFRFPGRSWPCRLRAGAHAVGDAEAMATINWPTTGHKLQATCRRLVIPAGRALGSRGPVQTGTVSTARGRHKTWTSLETTATMQSPKRNFGNGPGPRRKPVWR